MSANLSDVLYLLFGDKSDEKGLLVRGMRRSIPLVLAYSNS